MLGWTSKCFDNSDITKGQKVAVEAIKLTIEIREVYIIRGVAYHIAYFTITLEN